MVRRHFQRGSGCPDTPHLSMSHGDMIAGHFAGGIDARMSLSVPPGCGQQFVVEGEPERCASS